MPKSKLIFLCFLTPWLRFNTIAFSRKHVKSHIYILLSNTLWVWVDLQKYILDLDSSSDCLQYLQSGALLFSSWQKDPHTPSKTVFEWVENKTGIILSLCPSWAEKILQNKNISSFLPQVWPEHELFFSLHHKLSLPWKIPINFCFL